MTGQLQGKHRVARAALSDLLLDATYVKDLLAIVLTITHICIADTLEPLQQIVVTVTGCDIFCFTV